MTTWADRRALKLFLISLGLFGFGAIVGVILASASAALKIDLFNAADVVAKIPFVPTSFSANLTEFFNAHPMLGHALTGALFLGGLGTATRRVWIHDTFLASFNYDVLTPVTDVHRPDREAERQSRFVTLPWLLGVSGARRHAWGLLERWAQDGAFQRTGHFWNTRPLVPVSIQVLAGRAGSGKSRMAYEFCRHLARRDLLGGDKPSAGTGWKLAAWGRRVLAGFDTRPDDPWDAAILRPLRPSVGGHLVQAAKLLSGWRPRRPTILLLDDPIPGQTSAIVGALNNGAGFKHPVRLIITNQTVPGDSGFAWEALKSIGKGAWTFAGEITPDPPIILPPDAWFTAEETTTLALGSRVVETAGVRLKQHAVRRQIEDGTLFAVTKGHPLLVQLALEWLREKGNLAGVSSELLTQERAKRILNALAVAGLEVGTITKLLAVSTLIGGATEEQLRSSGLNFSTLPDRNQIKACFPSDTLTRTEAGWLPAVRPDMVGDAFVDVVASDLGPAAAKDIVAAAAAINPAALLRARRRSRRASGEIEKAMGAINWAKTGLAPLTVAHALCEAAIICQPDDRPLSTTESRLSMRNEARAIIDMLPWQDASALCGALSALVNVPTELRAERQIRPAYAMDLMLYASARASLDGGDAGRLGPWMELLKALEAKAASLDGLPEWNTIGLERIASKNRGNLHKADKLLNALEGLGNAWHVPNFAAVVSASAEVEDTARQARLMTLAATLRQDADKAHKLAARANILANLNPDDEDIAIEAVKACRHEARAWSIRFAGVGALQARACADIISVFAARFPQSARIQEVYRKCRLDEAYAFKAQPAGAGALGVRACADLLAILAARFPHNVAISLDYSYARMYEAYAWGQIPAGSGTNEVRACADEIARMAARFPDDVAIARDAAFARKCEAFVLGVKQGNAGALTVLACADQVSAIADRFPDDAYIFKEAAEARRHEAEAWSKKSGGSRMLEISALADKIATISTRFPDDARIATEVACAIRLETHALSERHAGTSALEVRACADKVALLATRFADDAGIANEVAKARRNEANAWSAKPAGEGALEARACADQVAAIAARFPDDASFAAEVAGARRDEAHAWCWKPAGEGALEARACADQVAAIAARFPDDASLAAELAGARRRETFAWSQKAAGAGALESRACADQIAAIAARLPDDTEIAKELAQARRMEGSAWGLKPAGDGALEARACAEQVSAIAAQFPNDVSIAGEIAIARRMEAYAWGMKPAGASALEARACADQVAAIAARFADDTGIREEARLAEQYATEAEAAAQRARGGDDDGGR